MKNKLIWIILVLSFLFLTAVYVYSRSNITVIEYSLSDSAVTHTVLDEFTKGKKITGEFSPKENYLGQVLIRFYNYQRINTDHITFRIREKGQNNWYYEHTYNTDQFLPDNLFTFGFPIIPDSKGKTYDFEIESVDGTPEESVTLSKISPLAALSFQYPKSLLIKSPKIIMEFLGGKLRNEQVNEDLIFNVLIYLNFIFLIMVLEYIFMLNLFNNKIKFNSVNVIVLGIIVIFISSIFYYLKKVDLSLQISILSYTIFIFGVIYKIFKND